MRRPFLARCLLLSLSPLGCSAGPGIPEASGKAVLVVDEEELVLDTGNDGKQPVTKLDDRWDVDCSLLNGVTHLELVDHARDRTGFYYLDLHVLRSKRKHDDAAVVNMRMYVDDELFYGSCPATLQALQADPHECKFSFSQCDTHRLNGDPDMIPARLEFASFHLRSCFIAPED